MNPPRWKNVPSIARPDLKNDFIIVKGISPEFLIFHDKIPEYRVPNTENMNKHHKIISLELQTKDRKSITFENYPKSKNPNYI